MKAFFEITLGILIIIQESFFPLDKKIKKYQIFNIIIIITCIILLIINMFLSSWIITLSMMLLIIINFFNIKKAKQKLTKFKDIKFSVENYINNKYNVVINNFNVKSNLIHIFYNDEDKQFLNKVDINNYNFIPTYPRQILTEEECKIIYGNRRIRKSKIKKLRRLLKKRNENRTI